MKVLYVTDLHGSRWKYERVFDVAYATQAKVVINGGDMLPKGGDMFRQGEFITTYLEQHLAQYEAAGIYYLCYLGNDDLQIFDTLFAATCAKFSYVINMAQRHLKIEDYEFVGLNWVVDYPFQLKDRCRRDTVAYVFQKQLGPGVLSTPQGWQELEDWLAYAHTLPTLEDEINRLVRPDNMAQSVYIIHMPPYRLGLDVCFSGLEVGSQAVYDFLAHHQPRLALHGHIHESPDVSGRWNARLGQTVCMQPGQPVDCAYVLLDLATMSFERMIDARQERNGSDE